MKNVTLGAFVLATVTVLGGGSQVKADTIMQAQGTPAPALSPILPFDVNFDNVPTGTQITANQFSAQGIASITNTGLPLFTFAGTQSLPNYVGYFFLACTKRLFHLY
jgi:hypothetical protein